MESDMFEEWGASEGASSDPFDGIAEAHIGRRIAAAVADTVAVLGAPWVILVMSFAFVVPFIELIPVVGLLLLLSCAGWFASWTASRLPNGERLSTGQMVAGLTALRTDDDHRVVLARDVHDARQPRPRRVLAARIGFALSAVVALSMMSAAGWTVRTVAFQTRDQAEAEARWQAQEPEARRVLHAFKADLLAGGPHAGEAYVVDDAADALSEYRKHLADTKVTAFEENGWGRSEGDWEYMFLEIGTTPRDAADPAQVSILIQQRGDRMVVTQLAWHTPSGTETTP